MSQIIDFSLKKTNKNLSDYELNNRIKSPDELSFQQSMLNPPWKHNITNFRINLMKSLSNVCLHQIIIDTFCRFIRFYFLLNTP